MGAQKGSRRAKPFIFAYIFDPREREREVGVGLAPNKSFSHLSAPPVHDTGAFPVAKTSLRLCAAASQKAAFALVMDSSAIRNADTQKSLESSARPTDNDRGPLSTPHPSSNSVSLPYHPVQVLYAIVTR